MLEIDSVWAKRQRVSEERMKICRECDKFIPATTQCSECLCFMRGKTLFMDSKCPIGKWGKHVETK
jgi:hypothetical protein